MLFAPACQTVFPDLRQLPTAGITIKGKAL